MGEVQSKDQINVLFSKSELEYPTILESREIEIISKKIQLLKKNRINSVDSDKICKFTKAFLESISRLN